MVMKAGLWHQWETEYRPFRVLLGHFIGAYLLIKVFVLARKTLLNGNVDTRVSHVIVLRDHESPSGLL